MLAVPWLNERFTVGRLLDAMPKGKPIISTDLGEPRAIVRNGINGYLVKPTVKELSEKLVAVLSDPEQLAKLSEGARTVSREYHIDSFVKRLENWYTELAKARRAAAH